MKLVDYLAHGQAGTHDPQLGVILVARNEYRPRVEYTVAHELMHLRAHRDVPQEVVEAYCDRGAAALMMPARTFLESWTACDGELAVLQGWWPHCSPLAILRRATDLMTGTAVSAWTRSRMHSRITSAMLDLPEHSYRLEEFVAAEALHGSGRSELVMGGVRVRAWKNGRHHAVTLALRVG